MESPGLSWRYSGSDSTLPLQGAQVRSLVPLVGEVSHATQWGKKNKIKFKIF